MTAATLLAGLQARLLEAAGLRVYAGGEGPPVVLLHGLGGAAVNWVEVTERLRGRYRLLVPDLPGHGGSPALTRGSGVKGFVDAIAGAIEAEGAAPALVAGHSFGGQLAAALAARHPESVRGVLLIAPGGIGTFTRRARVVVRAATVVRPGRFVAPLSPMLAARPWFRRAVFRPWFVSDPLALSARATHGFFADIGAHVDTRTAGRAMLADDARLGLALLGCPAIVLWGARDRQLPVDDAFEYSRRLRARLRLVADCGHLVIGERPDAVVDALEALEALEAAGPQTGFSTSR